MSGMLRGKRNRAGECTYGCCRSHGKREARKMYRARDKRQWTKEVRRNGEG